MVDRSERGFCENKPFSTTTSSKSRKSSCVSSEFDEKYREQLEGKYLGNGLEIRPPSGTNYQQPGSHLSIDTRISELSLDDGSLVESSHANYGSSQNQSQFRVHLDKPNCYIRSPFKQGYQITNNKPSKKVVDPSIQLKTITKDSISRVREQFRKPRPPPQTFYTPRLRKAKLKTTGRPISGSGPSIKQCKGIQAGGPVRGRPPAPVRYYNSERFYSTRSPSVRPASPSELHRPDSSIHCTSRAPSEDDSLLQDDTEYNDIKDFTNECTLIEDQIDLRDHKDQYVSKYNCDVTSNDECSSRNSLSGDQTEYANDLRVSEDEHKLQNLINTPHSEVGQTLNGDQVDPRDQRLMESVSGKIENTFGDKKCKEPKDLKSNDIKLSEADFDHADKGRINSLGTCRPFSDYKANDDDNHDDDDRSKPLLSNYQCSTKTVNQQATSDSNCNTSHDKTNEKPNNNKMNQEPFDQSFASCFFKSVLANNYSEKGEIEMVQSNDTSIGILPDSLYNMTAHTRDQDHELISVESCQREIETVENKDKVLEADWPNVLPYMDLYANDKQDVGEAVGSESLQAGNVDCNPVEDTDNESDIDRIPSSVIWENIHELNLSMNSISSRKRNTFSSNARKVKSAGAQRKGICHQGKVGTKPNTSLKSRPPSGKLRKSKINSTEEINKAELLRNYLAEESKKFSVNLPGYFTEQFNIIQEKKKDNLPGNPEEMNSKEIVKYDGEDCDEEEELENEVEGSTSLFSVEIKDSSSSGVFFTMESASTVELDDSMSQQTNSFIDTDSREFSDDTGFETMPGHCESTSTLDMKYQHIVKSTNHEDLEVVAQAKHITDPRSLDKKCPYEPLKFVINAQPPPGLLFYFAYGVDMNVKRMSLYLRREYKRRWGVLFGFKLCFNKKGSSNDAGGFANVVFSPGCSVEGCVYTISDAELSMLDNCVGYPKHYCRVVLPVWMCNCNDPDQHGVAQYCIPAIMYVAEDHWVSHEGDNENLDCSYSINQCLKASDVLSPNYIQHLNQFIAT